MLVSSNTWQAWQATLEGRVVAFLDIGTNSVRLLLVRLNANGSVTVLSQQKEVVRLGEDEFVDNYLKPEAMGRAAWVCRKFAEMARAHGSQEIIAIATSATREAENQADFVRLLQREAQIEVAVISGHEEARLIYLGIANAVHLAGRQAVFIDIGGGSTELAVGDAEQPSYLDSLKLGPIRLAALPMLAGDVGPIDNGRYSALQGYVRHAAVRAVQHVRALRLDLAYGSSGTVENLTDIASRVLHDRERKREDRLSLADLQRVRRLLCAMPLAQRRQVPGINPERADIIIPGAAILETLMQDLGLDELHVIADRGLREGLLVDYLARSEDHADLVHGGPVRERSVLQLARDCRFDEPHARHVANLALSLFDSAAAAGLLNSNGRARELLGYVALLHDIGSFLSYTDHELHTYYLIRNSELLGFDQTEVTLMATVALNHRKRRLHRSHPEYALLDKRSRLTATTLSVLLRIAESLDRSHTQTVGHVALRRLGKQSAVLEIQPAGDCQLELWGVRDHADALEKLLHCRLKIAVGTGPDAHEIASHDTLLMRSRPLFLGQ